MRVGLLKSPENNTVFDEFLLHAKELFNKEEMACLNYYLNTPGYRLDTTNINSYVLQISFLCVFTDEEFYFSISYFSPPDIQIQIPITARIIFGFGPRYLSE